MKGLKKDIPADFKVNIALDTTAYIKKSITEVEETLFVAFALVIIIIYLFFRDWLIAFRPLIRYTCQPDRGFLYYVCDAVLLLMSLPFLQ